MVLEIWGFFFFNGFCNSELYLTAAECYARKGNISQAMELINTLKKSRWDKTIAYEPLKANDKDQALLIILTERRKELCFKGTRWLDIRRLNREGKNIITQTRKIKGINYTLPPNDKRYVYPIPNEEILYSHIEQNER
uniref:RagB/SusD family nutrient uptake outer membrane protein n=1 Tax=Pedobacter schmidteae TaxID=2201271 RepID=UPI000EB1D935|nr:RagB/SusD family nutrient uptake outer membrane protein [Pedobacter schmidteae]